MNTYSKERKEMKRKEKKEKKKEIKKKPSTRVNINRYVYFLPSLK
jgi:hypothetical protein